MKDLMTILLYTAYMFVALTIFALLVHIAGFIGMVLGTAIAIYMTTKLFD